MSDNERLARELMGWHKSENVLSWRRNNDGKHMEYTACWHPKSDDAQADQVVREVAKRGFRWVIVTYTDMDETVCHDIRLYDKVGGSVAAADMIYGRTVVIDRNAHIVAAAIKALDSLEPKLHECDKMPRRTQWIEDEQRGGYRLVGFVTGMVLGHRAAHYCSFCGKPLGGEL